MVVEVEEAFLHRAAAILRSRPWQPDGRPGLAGMAASARILTEHSGAPDALEACIADGYENDLDW